jgi:hypothetical protein
MNIRLGAYDIFSRIIPGGLYLAVAAQLLSILGLLKFSLESANDISLIVSIGLLLAAYTLGGAFDSMARAWFRLFEKPGIHSRTFEKFKQRYQDRWKIVFDGDDYSLLLAFIRTKNLDLASEIERHNAVSIMLRNVSLGLMLLGINSLLQFLLLRNWTSIFVLLILIGLSRLIIQECTKFREMYYDTIFKTALAYRDDLENAKLVEKPKTKQGKPLHGGN